MREAAIVATARTAPEKSFRGAFDDTDLKFLTQSGYFND